MTIFSWMNHAAVDSELAQAFSSLEKIFALPAAPISKSSISEVFVYRHQNRCFYIKRFYQSRKSVWRYVLKSRCRYEWQNLQFFQSLGILTPLPIAFFEETSFGRWHPTRAALITEEIPKALDLKKIAEQCSEYFQDAKWRTQVRNQLAQDLAKLHKASFVHRDLHWRNILVTLCPQPLVYLFDVPQGQKYFGKFLHYFISKDLRQLDKLARQYLSKTERLAFFLKYRGHARLTTEDRQLLARVLG